MINNDSNTTAANVQGASKTLSIGGKKSMANFQCQSGAAMLTANKTSTFESENFDSGVPAGFGILPAEQFNDEYLRLIKADLAQAQAHLEDLPESQRRGLTLETLRHFHCGYLPKWINTKSRAQFNCGKYTKEDGLTPKSLPPASERIIIPTASMNHFNAVATPRTRLSTKKNFVKQHAGDKELFCDPAALNADIIVVVEGEVDAMTIWQVSGGKIAVVAILGCSNFRRTLGVKLPRLKGKKFILLLDADKDGKRESKKLRDSLIAEGYPAACVYLFDYMPLEFKKHPENIKIDANDILVHDGAERLNHCLKRVFEDALLKLDAAAEEIEKNKMPQGADPDIPLPAPRRTQSKSSGKANLTFDDNLDENRQIVADCLKVLPASQLTRNDWYDVGAVIKYYGFDFEVFDQWSNDGDSRYNRDACQTQWNSMKTADEIGNSAAVKIGTLIKLAKEFGYQPPRRTKDTSTTTGDAELDELLAEWRNAHDDSPIDPKIISEIQAAKEFVDSLTAENVTTATVASFKTRRQIALLTAYVPSLAKKYYLALRGLRDVSASAEEKEIKSLVAIVKSNQKKYQQKCADAARQARQRERATQVDDNLSRLEELKKQPQSPERDAEMIQLIRDSCEWKLSAHGDRVAVKATQANADLLFNYDPNIDGLFAFDAFQSCNVFKKAPPWDKDIKSGDEWKDSDDDNLQTHLRRVYREFASEKLIRNTFTSFSTARKFHEVKEYFNNLPAWDGVKRAETLFIDWLKIADTPYAREVTRKWLLGAVSRIFHAGCEFQWAIVLRGNQKIGKGHILKRLGGKWYKAISDQVDDSHAIDTIKLVWIGEFKEMKSLRKADVNAIKDFIERSSDTRRFAYDRYAKTIPRHCVFALTVNDEEFLSDLTGNRRFIVLDSPLPKFGYVREVNGESLDDDNVVEQIWAEVYSWYQELFHNGFDEKKLDLSSDAELKGEEIADAYVNDNAMTGTIGAFVDTKILPPVIWNLLTREERRKFFTEGSFLITEQDLDMRFKNSAKRISPSRQDEYNEATTTGNSVIRHDVLNKKTGVTVSALSFYGTEYRQHICAAEIAAECFSVNDKRNFIPRIQEILRRLEGWHLGKRIQYDRVYGDQKKIFYRDADNFPADDEPESKSTEPPADEKPLAFIGDRIAPDDTPF